MPLVSSAVWELAVAAVVWVPETGVVVLAAAPAAVVSADSVADTAVAVAGDGLVQLWAFCLALGAWEDLEHTQLL